MKRFSFIAAVLLTLALAGCGGGNDKPDSSGLQFKVVGSCTSDGGTLSSEGSGFTPGGKYVTKVWYPDGKEYTNFNPVGHASQKGTTPNWQWPCGPFGGAKHGDPPGTYKVQITDVKSDKTVKTTFTIDKP